MVHVRQMRTVLRNKDTGVFQGREECCQSFRRKWYDEARTESSCHL